MDEKKHENAMSMIRRVVKNGLKAYYVLPDSWFVNDSVIKGICAIKKGAMHVLGMCKIDKYASRKLRIMLSAICEIRENDHFWGENDNELPLAS